MSYTLKKHERLKRKRYFEAIFSQGKSVKAFPIRAIYLEFTPENFEKSDTFPNNSQIAFSAPKKRFKNATDRNRIKRQMLEAYRLNKHILNKNYAIVFVCLSNRKLDSKEVEKAIIKCLELIKSE